MILWLLLACSSETGIGLVTEEPQPPRDTATPPVPVIVDAEENYWQTYATGELRVQMYVDRSGSMSGDLARVGDLSAALAVNLDRHGAWTMTFFTTSQGIPGSLGPFSSLSEIENIRRAPAQLPGAHAEAGLGAVYAAPTQPGTLHIVFSDEDDQSYPPTFGGPWTLEEGQDGRWYWTVAEWGGWFSQQPDQAIVFVVAEDGCGDQSPRYREAAQLVGADVVGLCNQWDPAAASFSWPFTDPRTVYTLEHDPIPASVSVWFDGSPSWNWHLEGRDLVLHDPPPNGTPIRVTYRYWTL